MSSTLAPFGLRAVIKAGGTTASLTVTAPIASAYGTAIGDGDPVKLLAGNLVRAVGLAASDTTGGIIGSFQGVEYVDSVGKPQWSPQWVASTVATSVVAYYYADPYITYEIQANGTLTSAAVGQQIDFATVGPANTFTGLSGASADIATLASGTQKEMRIVGLRAAPDNAWGDAFPIILVQIAKHQFVTPVIGVA